MKDAFHIRQVTAWEANRLIFGNNERRRCGCKANCTCSRERRQRKEGKDAYGRLESSDKNVFSKLVIADNNVFYWAEDWNVKEDTVKLRERGSVFDQISLDASLQIEWNTARRLETCLFLRKEVFHTVDLPVSSKMQKYDKTVNWLFP